MTKAELIKIVSKETGFVIADTEKVVSSVIETIKDYTADGQSVTIRGFGNFGAKFQKEKTARNITKNTEIVVSSKYVPFFKPSNEFKDKVRECMQDKAR